MVVNGTGSAPPAATPSRAASAWGPSDIEQGVFSPCVLTMPTRGLSRSSSSRPQARRKARCGRAVETIDGDARAEWFFGIHGLPSYATGAGPTVDRPMGSRGFTSQRRETTTGRRRKLGATWKLGRTSSLPREGGKFEEQNWQNRIACWNMRDNAGVVQWQNISFPSGGKFEGIQALAKLFPPNFHRGQNHRVFEPQKLQLVDCVQN